MASKKTIQERLEDRLGSCLDLVRAALKAAERPLPKRPALYRLAHRVGIVGKHRFKAEEEQARRGFESEEKIRQQGLIEELRRLISLEEHFKKRPFPELFKKMGLGYDDLELLAGLQEEGEEAATA